MYIQQIYSAFFSNWLHTAYTDNILANYSCKPKKYVILLYCHIVYYFQEGFDKMLLRNRKKVAKFGGSSLADANQFKKVAAIVGADKPADT